MGGAGYSTGGLKQVPQDCTQLEVFVSVAPPSTLPQRLFAITLVHWGTIAAQKPPGKGRIRTPGLAPRAPLCPLAGARSAGRVRGAVASRVRFPGTGEAGGGVRGRLEPDFLLLRRRPTRPRPCRSAEPEVSFFSCLGLSPAFPLNWGVGSPTPHAHPPRAGDPRACPLMGPSPRAALCRQAGTGARQKWPVS